MTFLTRRDVLAHQAAVPWPSQRQVEQDLLLCRAMAVLFNDTFLCTQIAMRGGTLLHKVHRLSPKRRPLKGKKKRQKKHRLQLRRASPPHRRRQRRRALPRRRSAWRRSRRR